MTDGGEPSAGTDGRPPGARTALNPLSVAGTLDYERVLFFSDAVFAIAITLLVVDLRVPDLSSSLIHAGHQIQASGTRMLGFALSFAVIGVFWMGHHNMFRHIKALDRVLIPLNLIFLGTIAFLPYPTALLSAAGLSQLPAMVFYAVCVAAAGLAELAIWLYALRAPGVVPASLSRTDRRLIALRTANAPVVFLLSIPLEFVVPGYAALLWILAGVDDAVIRRVASRGKTDQAGP
jgi:uncharacterized membrane protein